MKVEWSKRALKGLADVVKYLEKNWSDKQIKQLENDLASLIEKIKNYNHLGIPTNNRANVRKGYPNRHTYLIYRLHPRKNTLYIINFRATKQKPA